MKKKNSFSDLENVALGLGGLGLATGIGSSIATKAGMPEVSEGLGTVASFGGILGTVYAGKTVLKSLKGLR